MREILKNYGALIGPFLAFTLGILAIYIKWNVDKQIDKSKSKAKLKKLIKIIKETKPPKTYFENKSENFIHADEARNLTNLSIYKLKFNMIIAFVNTIENEVLANCDNGQIKQFYELKFISEYSLEEINNSRHSFKRGKFEKHDFYKIMDNYERLINACENPGSDFIYRE
ncbi:hypothetical protein [Chishuiella sp.]|uniref:hypothetical protein n=1 Tax=Chishuiella sp. TaxID=1969467 RepID=UPI0028AAC741|nr:hypothetical protein [Chishuiella sp.]